MQLILEGVTKKYSRNKLFENLNYSFNEGNIYAVTGENGSGKSTLLKIIAGVIAPSKGEVKFIEQGALIEKEKIHEIIGIAAPYLNLIEEFTLQEHLTFQTKFKISSKGMDLMDEIALANLDNSLNKPVAEFSSGMQQRLKLILCCCFQTRIMLLDEPTSHLDTKGIEWYKSLLERTSKDKITLIASNNPLEYSIFTEKIINIEK
jgi:ABC-type multidrug transport system ATPase subunit